VPIASAPPLPPSPIHATRDPRTPRLGRDLGPELAEPFDMSLFRVSKHLKVLERAGLIERGREAQWRPCRLQANPLKDIADWVEYYRRHWEESFDKLESYLKELQRKEQSTQEKRDDRKK